MKNFFLAIILLTGISLFAQTEKGATPLPQSSIVNPKSSITRAVVIGISDYYDNQIPDLKYADRDAEAFAAWLQSPAGGSLTKDQIVLLTNAKATTAQFSAALDWLIEQSKEGDQAIIYFSGHGDVETKTIMNWGFLLTYTSPPTNYIAGAFPIYYLQSVIATLSQKNVKVVMISDACHAGKLAGSEFGGTQATALNLSKQFANEVKIMSCQPEEFSMEGEQWGGGRGAFSFHLVEGLTGMADKNADQKVQLLEIENYLEEILPKETAPQSQIPMTVGSKSSTVALVDEASLAQLKQRKTTEMPTLAKVETKGFEETVLEKADTSVQELYAAFLSAVERGDLLEPPKGQAAGRSANDYYERLIREESLAPLYGFMKRNLAAALHDEAQMALNLYLKTDTAELAKRSRIDSSYFRYPQYLSRAAELLGESHYMYRNLRAKQFYFEGLVIRLNRDINTYYPARWDTAFWQSETRKALVLQQKALEFETRAAFIYHELALLYRSERNSTKALECSRKSAELSPNWGLTLYYLGNDLQWGGGKIEEAIEVYMKALIVAPHYIEIYTSIAYAYQKLQHYDDAGIWLDKALQLNPNNFNLLLQIAMQYSRLGEFEKLEKVSRKMILISSNNWQKNTGPVYLRMALSGLGKHKEALEIYESLVESSDSLSSAWYLANLGLTKIELGHHEEGLVALKQALKIKPDDASMAIVVGQGYLKLKRYEEATGYYQQAFLQAQTLDQYMKPHAIYELVWTCAFEGETAMALQWLETILKEGYDDYERLQLDRTLADMRKTQNFKDLMREYFPEKSKD